jgi:hypothetical protein
LKLTVAGLLSLAALHDIATRTVPNWVSVAILIAGFALQAIVGTLLIACGLSVAVFVLAEVIRRLARLIQRIAGIPKRQLYKTLKPQIDLVSRPPCSPDPREFRNVCTLWSEKPPAVQLCPG